MNLAVILCNVVPTGRPIDRQQCGVKETVKVLEVSETRMAV
jgi:hypothetical protein